jgi:hypothetical protein
MSMINNVNNLLVSNGKQYNDFISPDQYGLPKSSAELRLSPLDMHMPRIYGTRWILCFPFKVSAEKYQM